MNINIREPVDLSGIRSYFFPQLLENFVNNENVGKFENIKDKLFLYFINANEKPTDEEICEYLLNSGSGGKNVNNIIDTCFLLNNMKHLFNLNPSLKENLGKHEVVDILKSSEDPKFIRNAVNELARKASIKKRDPYGILSFMARFCCSTTNEEMFEKISELCSRDLDWDAFVFAKLCQIDVSNFQDEFLAIKDNFLNKMEVCYPYTAELMRNGVSENQSLTMKMSIAAPIEEIVEQYLDCFVVEYDDKSNQNETKLVELEKNLFFLLNRALLYPTMNIVKKIYMSIAELKINIFSRFENMVSFRIAMKIAFETIKAVHQNNLSFTNLMERLDTFSVYDELGKPWVRQSMVSLLDRLVLALEDVQYPLVPNEDDETRNEVKFALQFSSIIVQSGDDNEDMVIFYRNNDRIIKCLTDKSFNANVEKHRKRLIAMLNFNINRNDEESSDVLEETIEPESAETKNHLEVVEKTIEEPQENETIINIRYDSNEMKKDEVKKLSAEFKKSVVEAIKLGDETLLAETTEEEEEEKPQESSETVCEESQDELVLSVVEVDDAQEIKLNEETVTSTDNNFAHSDNASEALEGSEPEWKSNKSERDQVETAFGQHNLESESEDADRSYQPSINFAQSGFSAATFPKSFGTCTQERNDRNDRSDRNDRNDRNDRSDYGGRSNGNFRNSRGSYGSRGGRQECPTRGGKNEWNSSNGRSRNPNFRKFHD